ncbi:MAG: hypothetical protein ACYTXT_38165 [Nostoc sp.]
MNKATIVAAFLLLISGMPLTSVSAMDGLLVLWKIKIAVIIVSAIAVKIMAFFLNGFILRHLLLQETIILTAIKIY